MSTPRECSTSTPTASRCSITSSCSSSSTLCRRARVSSSCCSSVACRAPTPEPASIVLSRWARARTPSMSRSRRRMSRSRSPAAVSTDDELVLRRADGGLGLGQLGVLRERAAAVGEPGELAVGLGEIQQPPLDGGFGFHVMLPMVQGSVRRVETRTSTLPPSAARSDRRRLRAPRPLRRPVRDVDERGRSGPQQVLRRGVVAQVGGDVGVDARRERRVERGVARAAADRDAADRAGRDRPPPARPTPWPGARPRPARRTPRAAPARAACRSGRGRASTGSGRAPARRTRAPRTGAPRAAPPPPRRVGRGEAPSPGGSRPPAPAARPRRSSGAPRRAA